MMNMLSTGISNKKIPAQFVVWIITLKICWCDDSNYGWYFMCGMLAVWINETELDKPNAEADSRQRKAQAARREVLKVSYFRIRVNDPRVIALWGKLKAEIVLSWALTHFSPLLPTRGQAKFYCNSNPGVFMMKFVTLKERQKANGWCKQFRNWKGWRNLTFS